MRGSDKGSEGQMKLQCFNLATENVLKGFPDKIRDQLSRHHTMWYTKQKHFKCTHFWITGDEIGVPVYIKTMQSCSSTFDTSSQSFQRQDDQEVHTISCFLSEADEMQYIRTPRVFPQVNLFFHLGKDARMCIAIIEIIFILFLNTTLFYNFILPVKKIFSYQ
jgi:hypothetical protein